MGKWIVGEANTYDPIPVLIKHTEINSFALWVCDIVNGKCKPALRKGDHLWQFVCTPSFKPVLACMWLCGEQYQPKTKLPKRRNIFLNLCQFIQLHTKVWEYSC